MIYLIWVTSGAFCVILALTARGITFTDPHGSTDADGQVLSAADARKWRWPSDIHRHTGGKAVMKHVSVFLLAIIQRLIMDRIFFYHLF